MWHVLRGRHRGVVTDVEYDGRKPRALSAFAREFWRAGGSAAQLAVHTSTRTTSTDVSAPYLRTAFFQLSAARVRG